MRTLDSFFNVEDSKRMRFSGSTKNSSLLSDVTPVRDSSSLNLFQPDYLDQVESVSKANNDFAFSKQQLSPIENQENHIIQPEVDESNREWTNVILHSVLDVIQNIKDQENHDLTDVFRNHSFVGVVNNTLALVQHQTRLIMVDYGKLGKELARQLCWHGFANFGVISFTEHPDVFNLCMTALDTLDGWNQEMLPKHEISEVFFD